MSDTVIKVENLSKKYILRHQQRECYVALRDVVTNVAKSLGRRVLSPFSDSKPFALGPTREEFFALKDISFEIERGERLGIIGRNGAGKTTLLKILSRITEPTSGRIEITGRVASLLEVGTGFHPELTGRENIFLNGAILGMKREEVSRKFDEIVDFAEIEKFLDTPVKRYSSGMYVRLAFAVAAHLETEILLVDEVLAVGDTQFQKKCLVKMEEVGRKGRTVLFVSHNMSAIEGFCLRGVVLENGEVLIDTVVQKAISRYLERGKQIGNEVDLRERTDRQGNGEVQCVRLRIFDENGNECTFMSSGGNYVFEIECDNLTNETIDGIIFSLDMHDEKENRVMLLRSNFENMSYSFIPGKNYVRCAVKDFPYADGDYSFSIFISHRDEEILDFIFHVRNIRIQGGNFFKNGTNGISTNCKVLLRSSWLT